MRSKKESLRLRSMSDALTMEGSLSSELIALVNEFASLSDKTLREDITKQAKELSEQLFISAPRAMFSEIKSKLKSLGWRFKRPPAGAMRRYLNHPTNAAGSKGDIVRAARARRKQLFDSFKIKRGSKQSGIKAQLAFFAANPSAAGDWYKANKPTLEEALDAVARYRGNHIGYIASTFIPAMRQLGSQMRSVSGEKRIQLRPMSKVTIEGEDSHIEITIINAAPGVVKVADMTGFVDTAIAHRIVDIDVYLVRKKEELARIWEGAGV